MTKTYLWLLSMWHNPYLVRFLFLFPCQFLLCYKFKQAVVWHSWYSSPHCWSMESCHICPYYGALHLVVLQKSNQILAFWNNGNPWSIFTMHVIFLTSNQIKSWNLMEARIWQQQQIKTFFSSFNKIQTKTCHDATVSTPTTTKPTNTMWRIGFAWCYRMNRCQVRLRSVAFFSNI